MSLRDLTDTAYAFLVEELRRSGVALSEAVDAVDGLFRPAPRTPEEEAALEAEREAAVGRRNEAVMETLMLGAMPPANRPAKEATA